MMLRLAVCAFALLLGSMLAQDPPASCKPITRYGVTGCELLPDRTCPAGYHQKVVDPPDPRMKAPSVLMCVPDKPEPQQKDKPTDKPPKSNR